MKRIAPVLVCLLFLTLAAQAADKPWFTGNIVRVPLNSKNVDLDLGAGEVTVTVNPTGKEIVVTPESLDQAKLSEFRIRFEPKGETVIVRVSGPHNNSRYKIEIPQVARLKARMSAGDFTLKGLASDADLALHAGDLTVELAADPKEFGPVDLSVGVGDVSSPVFGANKGGFFRSFHAEAPRRYSLKAHVGTGDLTVK